MGYTEKDIVEMIETRPMLYQRACINYAGKTGKEEKKEQRLYTEVIAEYIYNQLNKQENFLIPDLESIGELRADFAFTGHDGIKSKSKKKDSDETAEEKSNRKEEELCLKLFHEKYYWADWGRVVNYQVNLIKNKKININLVAYNEDRKIATIIEVKGGEKAETKKYSETLLRCILEIQTYFQILKKNEAGFFNTLSAANEFGKIIGCKKIGKGVYVPSNSRAAEEYKEMTEGKRPQLKALFDKFEIDFKLY